MTPYIYIYPPPRFSAGRDQVSSWTLDLGSSTWTWTWTLDLGFWILFLLVIRDPSSWCSRVFKRFPKVAQTFFLTKFRSLQNRPRTRLLSPMAPPWSNKVSQKGAKRSSKWTKNRPRGIFCGFGYIALTLKRFPCFGGSRGSKIDSFLVRGPLRKRVLILMCFLQAFSLLNLLFLCFYQK